MAQKAWLNKFLPTWAWFVLLLICCGIASIVGKSLHPDADQVYRPPLATTETESPAYSYTPSNAEESASSFSSDSDNAASRKHKFDEYDCTFDCSGHKAGYEWAERKTIYDGDDCDAAGDHYNSPSFAEGCRAYVDGETEPDDND
jgi:hypothetical protein